MADSTRARPGEAEEWVVDGEPTWAQVILRSSAGGLALAVGGLIWYALTDRWLALYALVLVVLLGVILVRRNTALWLNAPVEFARKYPLQVTGTVLLGTGVFWWMVSLPAGEGLPATVGLLFLGGAVLWEVGDWLAGRRQRTLKKRIRRLTGAKGVVAILVGFGTMIGSVLLYVFLFE